MIEQIIVFIEIMLIDLVLAGDNAIIIGMAPLNLMKNWEKKLYFGREPLLFKKLYLLLLLQI